MYIPAYVDFNFPGIYSRRESPASSRRFKRLAREVRKVSGRGTVGYAGYFCLCFITIFIYWQL